MAQLNTDRIKYLIEAIEGDLKHHDPERILGTLVDSHGAHPGTTSTGAHRLRLAGVTTTCTSKNLLLRNWCDAARRKIAEVQP